MRPTVGKPESVEFDAAWVLSREEAKQDIVGFYHTHPTGPLAMTARCTPG
jgi:proteasome lid subunit RPN8/RPN11